MKTIVGQSKEPPQIFLKTGMHPQKIMLYICWYLKCMLHCELLTPDRNIDSIVYCLQLNKLRNALLRKRPKFVSRKVTVTPHVNRQQFLPIGRHFGLLTGMCCLIFCIHWTLHHPITTCSSRCKTHSAEKRR